MPSNKNLGKAKVAKKDEFYTQLSDIEKELMHYKNHFEGKTVFCNCDDPYESNFFKYFAMNFNALGLKKLITTCYATSTLMYTQLSFFGEDKVMSEYQKGKPPYKVEITQVSEENNDGRIDLGDVEYLLKNDKNTLTLLNGDGDFRSNESVDLLKECDIVVTNPPFSLVKEYIAQLIEYNKKFLIIAPQNSLHYKEIFPIIQANRMWLGYNNSGKIYEIPKTYEDKKSFVGSDGKYYKKMGNTVWVTNLDTKKRHEKIILYKKFDENYYPRYVNFDAIDVSSLSDIPCDYYGMMGVPDTFLGKYNPEQFEIIGLGSGNLAKKIGVLKNYRGRTDISYKDENEKYKCPYSRIIIKRKA